MFNVESISDWKLINPRPLLIVFNLEIGLRDNDEMVDIFIVLIRIKIIIANVGNDILKRNIILIMFL
jgi:hypothetical protein